jgi:hypothetical protein
MSEGRSVVQVNADGLMWRPQRVVVATASRL